MFVLYASAFAIALALSCALTFLVRHLARRYQWLDHAQTRRSIHMTPIPRLGGIAIISSLAIALLVVIFFVSDVSPALYLTSKFLAALLCGGAVIFALGIYDDIKGAGALLKLVAQSIAALCVWSLGFRVHFFQSEAINLLITVLWMVGIINAVNLIDGLDGLAAGVAASIGATFLLLALQPGDFLLCLVMAALVGAVLGFLRFNFHPATIFMGDTGSLFLGFTLALSALRLHQSSNTPSSLLIPAIALGLPILDMLLAVVRRTLSRQSIFQADKDHLHHRMMSHLSLSQRGTVCLLYIMSVIFCLVSLGVALARPPVGYGLLAGLAVMTFMVLRTLDYLGTRSKPSLIE